VLGCQYVYSTHLLYIVTRSIRPAPAEYVITVDNGGVTFSLPFQCLSVDVLVYMSCVFRVQDNFGGFGPHFVDRWIWAHLKMIS